MTINVEFPTYTSLVFHTKPTNQKLYNGLILGHFRWKYCDDCKCWVLHL